MITNKDIRVENGSLILNGDPYPLDGQSPETIMQIVKDSSDTTPTENSTTPVTSGGIYNTIGDLTQTAVSGASVAAQITKLNDNNGLIKIEDAQISLSSTKTFDITSNGIYVLVFGHGGANNVLGLYLIKITHYAGGTFVIKVVTPQTNEPTVTASEITGNPEKGTISVTTTSQSGISAGLFKLNMPL